MSDIERRIVAVLQKGLPLSRTPYEDTARQIGIDLDQLLSVLNDWKEKGRLRRIGTIVNHFKVGFDAGAMVVWQVEADRIVEVGSALAGFKEVSHAYERQSYENWPYNLYTMVHGRSAEEVRGVVERMSRTCGVSSYRILVTEKELKKVAPTYIMDSVPDKS